MGELKQMGALEFVRRLKASCSRQDEKYAFFLGAGCSVSSGIPAAADLVKKIWLPKLFEFRKGESEFNDWIREEFPEYNPENPALIYGKVIEKIFPNAQERQDEIERICSGKLPGFGYGVFAELIARENNRFNVVATTNFDNLIADAMYLFTNKHPLVITHSYLVPFIRPTTSKPIIVKLHHDAQLGPCNVGEEIKSIDEKLKRKFQNLVFDRGLIFIGYGGNDPGVNEMLIEISEDAISYGVYWINGKEPQGEIKDWLEKRKAFRIDHFDFDEFMLLIKDEFDLSDPDRKHIEEVFNNYYEKLDFLGQSIESRDPKAEATKQLDKALKNAIEGIQDPYVYHLKAQSFINKNPDLAEQIYKAGISDFPNSIILFGRYAKFMHDVQKNYDKAEELYIRTLELDQNLPSTIGNYARFLDRIRNDYDRAEELYQRALELEPNLAWNIGNYAGLLYYIRKDYDKAEKLYQRALRLDPDLPYSTGDYARFLHLVRMDYDKAEELYARALELGPENVFNMGNYAGFLKDVRKDYDRAEELYKSALELEPNNVNNMGNYARLLHFIRKNYDKAEELYRHAMELDPDNAWILGNYACFMHGIRKDYNKAEKFYQRVIELRPDLAWNLGNYAGFLFKIGKKKTGLKQLIKAINLLDIEKLPALSVEVWFFAFIYRPDVERKNALIKLKKNLLAGIRSDFFTVTENAEIAKKENHPDADWILKLAEVIRDREDISILDDWPAWQEA